MFSLFILSVNVLAYDVIKYPLCCQKSMTHSIEKGKRLQKKTVGILEYIHQKDIKEK